jgi:uncharacterized protein YdeI (YjbR/CyaY-like superfamily)
VPVRERQPAKSVTIEHLHCANAAQWRAWLRSNHARSSGVWLLFYKKSAGMEGVDYASAVDEALSHGWIDSLIRNIDAVTYARKFTQRKPISKWSESNKRRIAILLDQGRLTPAGRRVVEAAQANGCWDRPDRPSVSGDAVAAFDSALRQNPRAQAFFAQLAPSAQQQYRLWISAAKREPTRQKRIAEALDLLARGEKLGLR